MTGREYLHSLPSIVQVRFYHEAMRDNPIIWNYYMEYDHNTMSAFLGGYFIFSESEDGVDYWLDIMNGVYPSEKEEKVGRILTPHKFI